MPQLQKFKEVYTSHYDRVYRLCKGYTGGDESAAQDLMQEAFIKVYTHLKSFREEASLSTWIYRITVNTCLLSIRANKKMQTTTLSFDVAQDYVDDTSDKEERLRKLYSCIDKLKGDDRALILLTLEKVSQKEIAVILGITHESVRVKMYRIKKQLTKCTQHGRI